ncbi:MAG: hypothetical protein JWL62_3170 [Hyphomicrobiales bacterium]|nr:hypothetical protein [Hyphomicrobiales bacterium]
MKKILLVSALALTLGACSSARDNRMLTGAAIGGAAGAVVGGVATGTGGGALIGGAIGAAGGAVIADATRPRYHHRRHCYYSSRYGKTVCR